jgi:hypothetical protein
MAEESVLWEMVKVTNDVKMAGRFVEAVASLHYWDMDGNQQHWHGCLEFQKLMSNGDSTQFWIRVDGQQKQGPSAGIEAVINVPLPMNSTWNIVASIGCNSNADAQLIDICFSSNQIMRQLQLMIPHNLNPGIDKIWVDAVVMANHEAANNI